MGRKYLLYKYFRYDYTAIKLGRFVGRSRVTDNVFVGVAMTVTLAVAIAAGLGVGSWWLRTLTCNARSNPHGKVLM